jgi:hypothetical protein
LVNEQVIAVSQRVGLIALQRIAWGADGNGVAAETLDEKRPVGVRDPGVLL